MMSLEPDKKCLKVAITHDWITNSGGGENVLIEMIKIFPGCDVYTAIYNPSKVKLPEGTNVFESWIGKLPFARTNWQWFLFLLPFGFSAFNLRKYDIIIASSYYSAHHVRANNVVCYKHSPARAVWGGKAYLKNFPVFPYILKPLAYPQLWVFKLFDRFYSSDDKCRIYANSKFTAHWCGTSYKRKDINVIYPPVNIARFLKILEKRRRESKEQDYMYWICWSRHVPQKRLEIAIKACAINKVKLVLAGEGVQTEYLKSFAQSICADVDFVGRVSDSKLYDLLLRAKGFVFPSEEDFGITPVEACAAGLKIVAYGRGGVCDWINSSVGELFMPQTAEACASAMRRSDALDFEYDTANMIVRRFAPEVFADNLKKAVLSLADTRINN